LRSLRQEPKFPGKSWADDFHPIDLKMGVY
jgi:hypothetical protein